MPPSDWPAERFLNGQLMEEAVPCLCRPPWVVLESRLRKSQLDELPETRRMQREASGLGQLSCLP